MLSPAMLRSVAFVKTDVLEECITSIIKVTRISELGTTSAVTDTEVCHPDDGDDTFLRNVGYYKSHTA
jgi:hypothetical protein